MIPAHSLKSSAATLGAHPLAATAKRLEEMARFEELSGALECWEEANRRLAEADKALAEVL